MPTKQEESPPPVPDDELEASRREMQVLVRAVSHDFRAPLRAITTFGGLLGEQSSELDGPLAESVHHMVSAAERLEAMVEGWLALARADDGTPAVEVPLSTVIASIRQRVEPLLTERNGTLTVGPLGMVVGRVAQLTKLFGALIDNAILYSEGPPKVTVEGRTDDGYLVVSVRDEGIGFEPRYLERIFELFQRLHSADEYPGVGAGLAVSRKIAQLHGGRITATSSPGDGAVFDVWLPVAGAAPQSP